MELFTSLVERFGSMFCPGQREVREEAEGVWQMVAAVAAKVFALPPQQPGKLAAVRFSGESTVTTAAPAFTSSVNETAGEEPQPIVRGDERLNATVTGATETGEAGEPPLPVERSTVGREEGEVEGS